MGPGVVRELAEVVGSAHVVTDPELLAAHVVDWTGRFRGHSPAMVRPGSTAEVAGVLDVCRRHQVALVPQGGNTGMVGGGVPLAGELVLSSQRLTSAGDVDLAARQITVGAGVSVETVQLAAAAAGLRYAVDFGARGSATIGGSIATNAGGINVLRHGGTREQLLGVEAVLGTGDVVSRLSGLVKDNTGYHLPGLLCGSEGTLGVVTAARLRLVEAPSQVVTALVGFATIDDAVTAVSTWRRATDLLDAAEIVLAAGVQLVAATFGYPLPFDRPCAAYVLVEASDHDDPTERFAELVAGAVGVEQVAVATDAARRAALWRYRDEHTAAINTVGVPHKFDVTLPIGALAAFMADVPHVVAEVEPTAITWLFGHVGDGNVHVNVTGVAPDADHLDERVLGFVVSRGGSISAEHGIGTAKARWLSLDRSAGDVSAMRAIKRALDPAGILNPGVLLA
ncbi:MAG: FAD-binding oxidoreductase [Acidimicrobiales bacterium]|nr:FAD-binding oxidoreductase [Acidimicrobiales bacterium]MCB9394153.1 FAD-binding oxidoreductase [Acidimicrobiaceae bacterium]